MIKGNFQRPEERFFSWNEKGFPVGGGKLSQWKGETFPSQKGKGKRFAAGGNISQWKGKTFPKGKQKTYPIWKGKHFQARKGNFPSEKEEHF